MEKLRDIWEACDRPRALVEVDNERRRRALVSFAIVLDMEVLVGQVIKMSKLTDRLADWTAHVCREDDDAFKQVLQIGMDFDEGLLHLDAVKETAWKKYLDERL